MTDGNPGRGWLLAITGVALAIAGFSAGMLWQSRSGGQDVREYLLAHPEVLPEAMEVLQKRENAKQLAEAGDDLEKPFPGAILGNPDGKVTLVEFSDFACGYCKRSAEDVEALVRENPDLRVVIRELPIISPMSPEAAKWGLAAAEQGKYGAFHHAMFAAGKPSPETIEAAARAAGLDLDRARRTIAEPRVAEELERNLGFARELGFDGTPSWVIGDEIHAGAVGKDVLAEAIKRARG